jgi:hypothetical protein
MPRNSTPFALYSPCACAAAAKGERTAIFDTGFGAACRHLLPGDGAGNENRKYPASYTRYDNSDATVGPRLQDKLQRISIDVPQARTGLSRNTILRARRGQKVREDGTAAGWFG